MVACNYTPEWRADNDFDMLKLTFIRDEPKERCTVEESIADHDSYAH